MAEPLLIATADIHLSENAPSFRSSEPDWFGAQRRQLRWLSSLCEEYDCPLVVAGDIFDKAIGTTRLVNFAIDEFPLCYAVAGNHDLPYHDFQKMIFSSYGTLTRVGKVRDIDGVIKFESKGKTVALHGFPFGSNFRPCEKYADIDIAVVHEFVWTGEINSVVTSIFSEAHISFRMRELPGYDYYFFGDNHKPFIDGNVVNCGSFYRRSRGDIDYIPSVVVLYDNCELKRVNVPVEKDVITLPSVRIKEVAKKMNTEFSDLFESMENAEALICDADEILKDYLIRNKVDTDVKNAITDITESGDSKIRPK